jgi:hypothetical protein
MQGTKAVSKHGKQGWFTVETCRVLREHEELLKRNTSTCTSATGGLLKAVNTDCWNSLTARVSSVNKTPVCSKLTVFRKSGSFKNDLSL